MERIIWVNSIQKSIGQKYDDGLTEVNELLADGWRVKLISAAAQGESYISGQAYIVLER